MKAIFSLLLAFAQLAFAAPPVEPVIVVGGGVGGLTAALYLARAGYAPLVLEGPQAGGLITQSHSVQNWPGEQEISGPALAERLRLQAEQNGARLIPDELLSVDLSKRPFTLTTRGSSGSSSIIRQAHSLILAMGTKPNYLGIPGESDFWGRGVSNCAVCDGSLYRDKVVGVVGGGDAAVLEALYLASLAREVRVFVRKDAFRVVEKERLDVLRKTSNIKIFFTTTVREIQGNEEGLTQVIVDRAGKSEAMPIDGLFLAIGSTPNTQVLGANVELDSHGYVRLKQSQETSVPGVYAIGDIADPVYKQAVSAAGDGAKAALQADRYLSDHGHRALSQLNPAKSRDAVGVIEIESAEHFQRELESSDGPVFVDFYASWCGPCRQVAPVVERFSSILAGQVKFLKIDVDRVLDLPKRYQIRSMPTALLLDGGGTVVDRKVGPLAISKMLQALEESQASTTSATQEKP